MNGAGEALASLDAGCALTVSTVAELRKRALAAMPEGDEFCLDLSRVDELDAAGIQFLAALVREADRRDVLLFASGTVSGDVLCYLRKVGFLPAGAESAVDWQEAILGIRSFF